MEASSKLQVPEDETHAIAVGYSRVMARHLGLNEKNLSVLLEGTRLSVEELMDDRTLLNKHQQFQIVRNAKQYSGSPSFGLEFGRAVTPPTHGPLGFLASSSPNLATAIDDFRSFIPGRINMFHSRAEFHNSNLEYSFEVDIEGNEDLYESVSEAYFLSLISLIEFVTGDTFSEGAIHCAYAKPSYYKEYAKNIHCSIRFDCSTNKLLIPKALLQTANVSSDHTSYKFALEQCQRMLGELDESDNHMTQRVRRQLLSYPPGKLSEEDTAQLNFISKRTLARRLQTENTSFRELKDELQASLAIDYLRDTGLSVEAVAVLLNYHDSSSFRRAFKRWTAMTPQQFRQNMH
ncbi:MAG: AraC family transcriptional regulator ligand-binding domain-containing protein [Pseudomonadota bacterium]|nr:AraC family transcriptional regulator ligand-binding domain-containing protein [Pseudomonadota bacterium]